jgi:hypothetical protein
MKNCSGSNKGRKFQKKKHIELTKTLYLRNKSPFGNTNLTKNTEI